MQNNRNTPEHRQWRREVLQRDGGACRVCEEHGNSHVHHIKPLEKYPDLATNIDNGITLCGNCHTRLKGKEESTNLQTIIEAVRRKPDMRTADQLERLNVKLCDYLEPLLKSDDLEKRNNAVFQLLGHLYVYPASLNQFLPLIQRFLYSGIQRFLYRGKESDGELADQIVVEFLKRNSSEAASQVVDEYKKQVGAEGYFARGVNHMEAGDLAFEPIAFDDTDHYGNAIVDFSRAIELKPDYADAYRWRGRAHMRQHSYDNAIEDYTKVIELNPNDAYAYSSRGAAYMQTEDYDTGCVNAIADFSRAIELKPDYDYPYLERGEAYWRRGNYDCAVADCTRAIGLKPDNADAYLLRGEAYSCSGRPSRATVDYTKAIQLRPNDPNLYLIRGSVYKQLGLHTWAQKDFEKAKQLRKKQ